MIDTDKYEGHIDYQKLIAHIGKEKKILEGQNKNLLAEVKRLQKLEAAVVGSWLLDNDGYFHEDKITGLLAEVKRLREQMDSVRDWVESFEDEHIVSIFKIVIGEEE